VFGVPSRGAGILNVKYSQVKKGRKTQRAYDQAGVKGEPAGKLNECLQHFDDVLFGDVDVNSVGDELNGG
jgi:hypothetical protein